MTFTNSSFTKKTAKKEEREDDNPFFSSVEHINQYKTHDHFEPVSDGRGCKLESLTFSELPECEWSGKKGVAKCKQAVDSPHIGRGR